MSHDTAPKSMKGRLTQSAARSYGLLASLPFRARQVAIQPPAEVSHADWEAFLVDRFDKPGLRILEIGSRNVTGADTRRKFKHATYVGFDIYPGQNVDVVGDAHQLSRHFTEGEQFDLIYSSAVFEHLYMPWVAAQEIHKTLKIGGHVFVETHFAFRAHERPWNFFQFSDMGLRALFNESLGFDLIDSGMSNPIAGYFGPTADRYLRHKPVTELYCHSEILCVKNREADDFDWRQVEMDGVVGGTRYPAPSA